MAYELLIDIRENVLKEHFPEECFTSLDIADIIIKKDGEIVVAVERKTIDDLKASILDGRWKEQKLRLCSNVPRDRIFYLIEGNIMNKTTIKGGSNTLIGAIVNCMLRDKIKVYKTNNLKETIGFIRKMYDSVQKKYDDFFVKEISIDTDYANTVKVKKKENHNPNVWYKQILLNIPQVSQKTADCIIERYPSLKKLYESVDESVLKNLTYTTNTGKTRKLGPKLASKIVSYLSNDGIITI